MALAVWGPLPVKLSYQWLADGRPIDGATGVIFHPGSAQLGKVISVTVTGTKTGYLTATITSKATGKVKK